MYPYPVLYNIGSIEITTYGFFIAFGILISTILAAKKDEKVYDLTFYVILLGLICARLLYVIENNIILNFYKFWDGGLSWYGALIGGIIGVLYYTKKNKLNFWKYANKLSPYLALGIGIGRIGCFLRGCCYGIQSNLPWAINYLNEFRHPTQLYLSAHGFLIFFILRKIKNNQFAWFLILYSVGRFLIDFLRVYDIKYYGLSLPQIISIFTFLIGLILFKKERFLNTL
ncbi:MAG: prolipoprotein diacylglyceryl transferase [Candidatus Woesearchaeota archaeon]